MRVTMNFYEHRDDPEQRSWDLPPWGHMISKGVLPLFIRVGDRLHGIGTAFWVGRGVPFIMTALHNVVEALRHEPVYERQHAAGTLPAKIDLKSVGLYVLHQDEVTQTNARFTLLPLETVNGGPPSDVVFGYPKFDPGRAALSPPVSFDPPRIGSTVWSIGYTDFEPAEGIPMSALGPDGDFDWLNQYKHRLVVTEGQVRQVFTTRFIESFIGGPCFTFDSEIAHGQSGGPVMTTDGLIVGVNSAGASHFFNAEMSLASMLYPLLLTPLQFGADLGQLRLNASRPLIDLVMQGVINTDGSEEHVALIQSPEGPLIGPRTYTEDRGSIFADFHGFQKGEPPQAVEGPITRFRRSGASPDED